MRQLIGSNAASTTMGLLLLMIETLTSLMLWTTTTHRSLKPCPGNKDNCRVKPKTHRHSGARPS